MEEEINHDPRASLPPSLSYHSSTFYCFIIQLLSMAFPSTGFKQVLFQSHMHNVTILATVASVFNGQCWVTFGIWSCSRLIAFQLYCIKLWWYMFHSPWKRSGSVPFMFDFASYLGSKTSTYSLSPKIIYGWYLLRYISDTISYNQCH